MKVMLISPNTGRIERIENEAAWPPLGLFYIGTVLQNAGHEVRVINNSRAQLPIKDIVKGVKRENPQLVDTFGGERMYNHSRNSPVTLFS